MTPTLPEQSMFIAGRKVPALEGATEPVSIRDGRGDRTSATGTSRDVDRAVDAADGAFEEWANTPPGERARALLLLADRLEEHTEEFARWSRSMSGSRLASRVKKCPLRRTTCASSPVRPGPSKAAPPTNS